MCTIEATKYGIKLTFGGFIAEWAGDWLRPV